MSEVFHFDVSAVMPTREDVLAAQGVPRNTELSPRVVALAEDALRLFEDLAQPKGVREDVSREAFAGIFEGEGQNAPDAALTGVLPEALRLALFAVTVGQPVCDEIQRLFDHNDPALGCMLDGVASVVAENMATVMAKEYQAEVVRDSKPRNALSVLPYSPGYCGWDTSGQRSLFVALGPEIIGITLNSSCLMQPLKSVSGVLVAAPPEDHEIEPSFSFCSSCLTQECRDRAQSARAGAGGGL
jgi:hypothetical protein